MAGLVLPDGQSLALDVTSASVASCRLEPSSARKRYPASGVTGRSCRQRGQRVAGLAMFTREPPQGRHRIARVTKTNVEKPRTRDIVIVRNFLKTPRGKIRKVDQDGLVANGYEIEGAGCEQAKCGAESEANGRWGLGIARLHRFIGWVFIAHHVAVRQAPAVCSCSRSTGRSRIGQLISAANRASAIEIHHIVS